MSNNDEIIWDKYYWLTWDDFCGSPDYEYPHDAHSVLEIRCKYQTELIIKKTKSKLTFKNINLSIVFYKKKSWVKSEWTSGDEISKKLLKHEQGHFDGSQDMIQRIYSRKLAELENKTFSINGKTIQETEANRKKETERIILKLVKNANHELINFHEKYDRETKHGTISQTQELYDARFAKLRS